MTAGTLLALDWTSATGIELDLHSIPGGLWCDVTQGLDDLPKLRSSDDVIPFRAGRLRVVPLADSRPVLIEGRLLPHTEDGYPRLVHLIKKAMNPLASARGTLTAKQENGATWTIEGVAVSVLYGEPLRLVPNVSIELDADPYWRGPTWGDAWTMDMGLFMDTGLTMDMDTGPVTLTPAMDPDSVTFQALGTTGTLDAVVEVTGPSTSAITVFNADGIGFGYPALTSGQTLIVDAGNRTAMIGLASVRGSLTLLTPNSHGEFFRLRAGTETVTATGKPFQVIVRHRPSYL